MTDTDLLFLDKSYSKKYRDKVKWIREKKVCESCKYDVVIIGMNNQNMILSQCIRCDTIMSDKID